VLGGERGEEGVTLVEMMVTTLLLVVVVLIIMSFLISMTTSVSVGTARAANDSVAKGALSVLEADLRFASNISIASANGGAGPLWVASTSSPTCAEWYLSGTNLVEQTSSAASSVVARGVSALQFTGHPGYQGLVTVGFTVALPQFTSQDKTGTVVNETIAAQNMAPNPPSNTDGSVQAGAQPVCSLP
jgi:Tfp pilus assembly protein PilW